MALENVDFVTELVQANPPGTDVIAEGDNHIRLIKKVLKLSFPDVDRQAATIIVKTTAPATQIKGTIWYDTTTNLLKINTADDAATASWVTVNVGAPWAPTSPASTACFRAHRNGVAQDMDATTAYQLVEFTHEDFDNGDGRTDGGHFVEGDGVGESRFVIQADGAGKYYLHTAILEGAGTGDDDVIAIYKNGALEAYTNAFATYSGVYGSVSRTRNVSCIVSAVAADYFEVFYQTEHNQGEADIAGARTASYFEGYKLT